jgi:hypothetical protein
MAVVMTCALQRVKVLSVIGCLHRAFHYLSLQTTLIRSIGRAKDEFFYAISLWLRMDGSMPRTRLFSIPGRFSRSTGTSDSLHLAGLPFISRL